MRLVVALGGNALLSPGERPTPEGHRRNIAAAAKSIAPILEVHEVILTHGNGPHIGHLAAQQSQLAKDEQIPLDVIDALTEGWLGYLIEQEILNTLPLAHQCATILTQAEVAPDDSAFDKPTKPIGRLYSYEAGKRLAAEREWDMIEVGDKLRRVVPSPRPVRIIEIEAIRRLVQPNTTVICAGGGGIPVIRSKNGALRGVEAVIDKDRCSALLASQLQADGLMLLTNVDAVFENWGQPNQRPIQSLSEGSIGEHAFEAGTMGPKVEAAGAFVRAGGDFSLIGSISQAEDILAGKAGTRIIS